MVTVTEMDNAGAALRALDKNGDGRLSGAELGGRSSSQPQGTTAAKGQGAAPSRKRQGSGGVLANLLALDADGDGKLSRSEVPSRMQRIFDRADADKNCSLDRAEIDKFTQQLGPGRGR